jgi:uncharacterized membrane protein YtjA (UPF0391 family)
MRCISSFFGRNISKICLSREPKSIFRVLVLTAQAALVKSEALVFPLGPKRFATNKIILRLCWLRDAAQRRKNMFGWALTFLIIALIAAFLGFGGIAGTAIGIAKLIFFVALALFVVSLIYGLISGRRPPAV